MIAEWTNRDTAFLKKFLSSDTGVKIVEDFKAREPEMDETSIEGRALQAAAYEQWRKDKNFIKNLLIQKSEPKTKDPYIDMSGLDVRE